MGVPLAHSLLRGPFSFMQSLSLSQRHLIQPASPSPSFRLACQPIQSPSERSPPSPPPSTCLSWKEWRRRGRGLSFCLLRNVLHSLSLSPSLSGPFLFLPPLPCLSAILVLTWKGRRKQGRSGSWKRGRPPRNRLNTSAAGGSKRSVGGTASPPPLFSSAVERMTGGCGSPQLGPRKEEALSSVQPRPL